MSKTAKQLAAELLFKTATGAEPYRPKRLSKEAQAIADMVAGVDRPEEGTPAAQLAAMRNKPVQQAAPQGRLVPSAEMEQMVEKLAEEKAGEKVEAWLRSNGYRIEPAEEE